MRFSFVTKMLAASPLLSMPAAAAPSAQRVKQLFKGLPKGDLTTFWPLFTPEATWTTAGFGVNNLAAATAVFEQLDCLLENAPLKIEIDLVISQGKDGPYTTTQAHVPNGIIGTNGVQYNQTYLWLTKWKGEKIVAQTEYLNGFLASELIGEDKNGCWAPGNTGDQC